MTILTPATRAEQEAAWRYAKHLLIHPSPIPPHRAILLPPALVGRVENAWYERIADWLEEFANDFTD